MLRLLAVILQNLPLRVLPVTHPANTLNACWAFLVVISAVVIRSVVKPLWLLLGDKVTIGFEVANHVVAASRRAILIAVSPEEQRVLGSLCLWIIKTLEVRALDKAKIFTVKRATVEHGCALVFPLFSVST